MTDLNANHRERMEKPESGAEGLGIETVKRMANEVMEKDKNPERTADLAGLDVLHTTEKDKEALTFMQSEILNVITKIGKKYPDKSLNNIYPGNLADIVRDSGIELRPSENIALSKLELLNMNQNSPASRSINAVWAEMVKKAEDARNGFTDKIIKRFKEKPGETLIYAAAGAAGIYLGFKLIKWLGGKAMDKAKNKIKDTAGEIFSTGNILAALGIGCFGAYWGRDWIKKKFYETLGITEGVGKAKESLDKAIDNVAGLTEQLNKATSPEEITKLQEQIMEQKKKIDEIVAAGGATIETVKNGKDELLWSATEEAMKRKISVEEREQAENESEFLKNLNIGLKIKPQILAVVNNEKYSDFLAKGPTAIDYMMNALSLLSKDAISAFGNLELSLGSEHLIKFFTEILKNKGKSKEFEGKTVGQVLELIKNRPEYFMDKEALDKAKEKDSDFRLALSELEKAAGNKELLKNRGWWDKFLGLLGRGGYTFMADTAKGAGVWVLKNGVTVGYTEAKHIVGAMHWIANEEMGRDSYLRKFLGTYLWVGAYTMAIGAPIGGYAGFAGGYLHGGFLNSLKGAAIGTVKGGMKGLMYPAKFSGEVFYEWLWNKHSPLKKIEGFMDLQRFFLEDLKLSQTAINTQKTLRFLTGKEIFNLRTISEKILAGEIDIDNRLMRRLDVYRLALQRTRGEIMGNSKKSRFQKYANRLEEDMKRIDRIQDIMTTKEDGGEVMIDEEKWARKIDKDFAGIEEKYRKILKGNKRLGIIMFDEANPLAKACLKNTKLIEYLDTNKDLFELLAKKVNLINEPEIQKILESTGEFKAEEFEAKVRERSKLGKPSVKEIAEVEEAAGKTTAETVVKAAEADAEALSNPKTPEEVAAKKTAEETLEKAKALEQAEDAAKGAKQGSKAAAKLAEAEKAVTESAQTTAKAIEAAGKSSKVWQVLKFAGKWGGAGAAGLGSAVSLYEAGKGFYEAATTNIEGRAGIEASHASLLAINGAADAALLATMVGAKSATLSVASRAWAPLIPVTWAANKAYESVKEENMKEYEWAQKYSYDDLIHQWFTTEQSRSEGDAVVTGFSSIFSSETLNEKIDKDMASKRETARKMFKVLVSAQSNPELLSVLYSEKPSEAKDKKIEELMNASYSKYHEYYFRMESGTQITNYESARKFINNACAFNEIMQIREQKKSEGVEQLMLNGINIMDKRYEINGDVANPKAGRAFMPSEIVKNYRGDLLEAVKEQAPLLSKNIDKIDTPYLVLMYVQIIKNIGRANEDERKSLNEYSTLIRMCLKSRDVNVDIAAQNPDYINADMPLDELIKNLKGMNEREMVAYRLFEKANVESKPGIRAMYRLAQYFGYTGYQKEVSLRSFFTEEKANFHGIYWKDGNWYVQKEGWGFDTKIGASLDGDTIEKMTRELYANADNVLEHRKSATFATAYDFTDEVKKMAGILENGYNEAIDKYKYSAPRLSIISELEYEKKAA